MKILLYGVNFAPEPTGIGKFTGEMAEWLSEAHEVRVVTAPPYYPAWKVTAPYSALSYKKEQYGAVQIWRCPIWIPKKLSGIKRLIHLVSFSLSSIFPMLAQIRWKPDVVWVCAPSLAAAPMGVMLARISNSLSWIHIQDYEVDVAFDLGLLKGDRARRGALSLERKLLSSYDVVSSISALMVQKAIKKGVPPEKTYLMPNWVDIGAIYPMPRSTSLRKKLGIADDEVVALFSGTLAAKQDLHVIPKAAKILEEKKITTVRIIICGDGALKPSLEKAANGLRNVIFLPLQPKEKLNELLATADIHLLPQDPAVSSSVMPSKLTAMLASGRPVVSSATIEGEIAHVLSDCGMLSSPGDPVEFAAAIERLASDEGARRRMGDCARRYAVDNLSQQSILRKFINSCLERRHQS